MAGIVIGAVIVVYTAYVIVKKYRALKAGKTCCGGCSNCPSKGKCNL